MMRPAEGTSALVVLPEADEEAGEGGEALLPPAQTPPGAVLEP